ARNAPAAMRGARGTLCTTTHKMHNQIPPKNGVTRDAKMPSVEIRARKELRARYMHAPAALDQQLPTTSQISLWEAAGKRSSMIARHFESASCAEGRCSNCRREIFENGNRGHRHGPSLSKQQARRPPSSAISLAYRWLTRRRLKPLHRERRVDRCHIVRADN